MLTADTPSAADLNAHLAAGGVVQVTTYLRSWIYTAKHAGMFSNRDGALYVRQGRATVQLSQRNGVPLVGIRLGRQEAK